MTSTIRTILVTTVWPHLPPGFHDCPLTQAHVYRLLLCVLGLGDGNRPRVSTLARAEESAVMSLSRMFKIIVHLA